MAAFLVRVMSRLIRDVYRGPVPRWDLLDLPALIECWFGVNPVKHEIKGPMRIEWDRDRAGDATFHLLRHQIA